jgi:hypothetical protein
MLPILSCGVLVPCAGGQDVSAPTGRRIVAAGGAERPLAARRGTRGQADEERVSHPFYFSPRRGERDSWGPTNLREAQGPALRHDGPVAASRACPQVKGSRRSIPRACFGCPVPPDLPRRCPFLPNSPSAFSAFSAVKAVAASRPFRLDDHVNPGNPRKRRPFIRRKFPFLAPHL